MGSIDYRKIYETNQDEWKALTREPQKYEALLAGHYSDSNHFVYELLQNAEDEKATRVVIEFYNDQLIFYHNGDPFDEDDVRGVSSMLMGTKDRNDAQTIGRFGMGFKSVFKYTYQPEIYSDDEAFVIRNYLLPVESDRNWDFRLMKSRLAYLDGANELYTPFAESDHLTRIIIPFKKRNDRGEIYKVNGRDVLDKLNSLTGEILLFLTHIQDLYWVNRENGQYAHITLGRTKGDENLLTCRISSHGNGGKEDISRYLKYKKSFDHPDMKSAEVSVAYRLNSQARNVIELEKTPIWVYFPTRDMTDLPFLVHGSFETAVSREKLMTPSRFNQDLFACLGDLIAESMMDLARRDMITQMFLRRVIITAFRDEEKNGTIQGLREKLTNVFREKGLIPDRTGKCRDCKELAIAIPFRIADMKESTLFRESVSSVDYFVAFNNEKERNFNEYYIWLRDDLQIREYRFAAWASELCKLQMQKISGSSDQLEDVRKLYDLISDHRESLFSTAFNFSRSGAYEYAVRESVKRAWEYLRIAPIVLNRNAELIPAYQNGTLSVYLAASSRLGAIGDACLVSSKVAKDFEPLFRDGLGIVDYNNFQYVKENVISKYVSGETAKHETEYLSDIRRILELVRQEPNNPELAKLLEGARIVKIKRIDGTFSLECPNQVYSEISDEGINLRIYYSLIYLNPYIGNCGRYCLDLDYYEKNDISISDLKMLGIVTSPVIAGNRFNNKGTGDNYWFALDDFCPNITFQGLAGNIDYIKSHRAAKEAREKSVELLKLLLSTAAKLRGWIRRRKTKPYDTQEQASILVDISYGTWLYDRNNQLKMPAEVSRYDLDPELYGSLLDEDKEKYKVLGFIEKEDDSKAETFELVGALNTRDKKIMFKQLARELGYDISSIGKVQETSENETFDVDSWQSEEFPQRRVRNYDSLIEHVRQEFFCADPVKYQKVLRQIRTSKSSKTVRAYSLGMYLNESDTQICQMCRKAAPFVDVTEIANFGIEMPQLNLCLCKNCSSRYKQFRDGSKESFRTEMTKALRRIDIDIPAEEYEITLSSDTSIFFTQTHLAEIKEILSLIEQYGIPGKEPEDFAESSKSNVLTAPESNNQEQKDTFESRRRPDVSKTVQTGSLVQHKAFGNGKVTFIDGPYMEVSFPKVGVKKFQIPDAFKKGFIRLI